MNLARQSDPPAHPGRVIVVDQALKKTWVLQANRLPFEACFCRGPDGAYAPIEFVLLIPQADKLSVAKYAPGKRLIAVELTTRDQLSWQAES